MQENADLYEAKYTEGFTTELPQPEELRRLMASNFEGSAKDYRKYLDVLAAVGARPGMRLFDFGCSWGYGSWQLSRAGYSVESFEISGPRSRYAAEKLGVKLIQAEAIEEGSYDVFFSSHVIEHVPKVSSMFRLGMTALRPGGIFIAFSPNGSNEYRMRFPKNFHLQWGFAHPQLIDWVFLSGPAVKEPLIADSSPFSLEDLRRTRWSGRRALKLDGAELAFVIKRI